MLLTSSSATPSSPAAAGGGEDGSEGSGGAMKQMKVLRTLRLLRLLRLFRVFKGIEKVNQFVDVLLDSAAVAFVGLIVVCALTALLTTMALAVFASAKAWLAQHHLPEMPEIQ
eukprot:TRINITY_DN30218_c0_g1_i1.p2 TRINITY_DN30218_c0_g1~~TRINITY_DN30218_c0_g1_i1.p2  ORF type:complete len:113 (-),score=39.60 TRINITY_DN30218_c0_g1_i1:65-403(-)